MRRALAVLASVAMLGGAVAVRSRMDRDPSGGPVPRLTCASGLGTVCETLAEEDQDELLVVVEPAGVTADRLASASGDPGLDGWLVAAPWSEMVDAGRRSQGLPAIFAPPPAPVARSPLVLVTWKDRAAALAPRCPDNTVGWRCLGEAAGTAGGWPAIGGQPAWGPVKPGHAPPSTDAVGLLALGQATASYFGRTDLSASDLDDDGFRRWFGGLERSVPPSPGSPLGLMLATGPAAYDAVGTTEAEAAPLVERSSRRTSLDLLYPSLPATADAVLVTADTDAGRRLREVVGDTAAQALAADGWRVPGEPRAKGVPPDVTLAPDNGLPPPGLLDALRTRWKEETGRP